MNFLATNLALLALTGPTAQDTAPQESRAPVERAADELVHPEIRRAMEEVFRFDRRLLELGILNERGVPGSFDELVNNAEGIEFLTSGEEGLFVGRSGFAFGDLTPHFEQLLECGRHDRGRIAVEALLEREPDLEPNAFLDAITDEFLEADPVEGSLQAKRMHDYAMRQYRLAPLSNGSVAYLVWGLLFDEEYWAERPGEREAFIADLLDRGATSQMCGMAVRRALQAPLLYRPDQKGQGVAFYLFDLRDRVGYTRRHQKQLEDLVELVERVDDEAGAGPNPLDPAAPLEAGAGDEALPEPSRLGHLREWAPEMLQWVLYELEPERANELMRVADSLEERKTYWSSLANTVPFSEFRQLVVDGVKEIVEGLDSHPASARIEALESLERDGLLTPEQASELEELRSERLEDRRELVRHMAQLLALSGVQSDLGALVETLAGDLHDLIDSGALAQSELMAPYDARLLLRGAWITAASSHDSALGGVIDRVLLGDLELPGYAQDYLFSASLLQLEGGPALLDRILIDGTVRQRSAILRSSSWLDSGRYAVEIQRLLEESRSAEPGSERQELAWKGAAMSLVQRKGKHVKELLIDSIRAGDWRGSRKTAPWVYRYDGVRDWVLELLTSEELAEFENQGLIDPGFDEYL